ncbi:Na(+)/H(+) antiporter subunit D [Halococcus saccharolyticus]|uniref:Monovalent cation/H+ antiporter subunit D n=1 Tax=Halococcus saccharolyticus DSM 5350 TaxID=1227455 RepID=M0MA61_9EURY|nr:Na(+)/H(+) antiporter subunit D [Halococcus saccharolyticus]EMA42631.1 monovalent cation/H+ antiporter subunit D [Halococcus saccharolyticus DSM 5350]
MVDPVVPPFVPVLLAAAVLPFLGRRAGHVLGIIATGVVVPYVWLTAGGQHLQVLLFGFEAVLYNVDPFSTLMGLIFGFIGAVAVLYSWYTEASSLQTALALSYVGTSLGAVFGGDWLTLIFFWELMAVTSTLLVWHYGGRAVRAGFRYALLHGLGGTLLLGAVVWHYVEVGSFLFSAAPGGMAGGVAPVLAAVGIGVNVGFIGLHAWLPDTYPRPHVAASIFLCVFTTKTGVYGMYRAFPDGNVAIAYMGGLMAVFGATYALFQNDMRRLLSYHIQSQVGYMVAGVGIGTALGQAGAMAHVFNHILYKALLFMTAGVVIYRTGKESLKKLGGLGREMPVTAAAFTVAALSIAGFPLFNGFVSKGIIISASHYDFPAGPVALGDFHTLEVLLLLGGVGTFLSFIKFGYYAFFHGEYDDSVADANRGQTVAMVSLAVLCIFYGIFDGALFALLPFDVTDASVVSNVYVTYTVDHVVEGVVLAAIGLVGFVLIKKPLSSISHVPDIDSLYNPAALYGTRAIVVGITELYAVVDRTAATATGLVGDILRDPEAVLERFTGRDSIQLRVDIGTSVALVTLVIVGVLVLMFA